MIGRIRRMLTAIARRSWFVTCLCAPFATVGCAPLGIPPGTLLERSGDEIVICGQLFHTGTPVVLWTDPGGYDAYRVENRFENPRLATSQPAEARYGSWRRHLLPDEWDAVW